MIETKIDEQYSNYSHYQNPYIGIDTPDRQTIKYTITNNVFRYDLSSKMLVLVESNKVYQGITKGTKQLEDKIYIRDILDTYLQGQDNYSTIVNSGHNSVAYINNATWYSIDVEVISNLSVTHRWTYVIGYDGAREPYINSDSVNSNIYNTFGYNHLLNFLNKKKYVYSNQPIYIKFGAISGGEILRVFVGNTLVTTQLATPYGLYKLQLQPSWFNNSKKLKLTYSVSGTTYTHELTSIGEHCGDWITIVNQYGGLDTLPINKSSYNKFTIERNSFISNNLTNNYSNNVTDSVNVNTARMYDSDYQLIRSVLTAKLSWINTMNVKSVNNESNVYTVSNIPVVINTDTIEQKTFKKDKVFQYNFEVNFSQKSEF